MNYTIRVYGIPKGSPRPRATKGFGGHAKVYMPPTCDDWKGRVAEAVMRATPKPKMLTGTLRVDVTYLFPRPKSLKKSAVWHTKRPDRDNCDKTTLDALVQCGALKDDNCVCAGTIYKRYADADQEPGAFIWINTEPGYNG